MAKEFSHQHVVISALKLDGDLGLPPNPKGIVLFAHGAGSSRLSPRNQSVATSLNQAGIATLLFDLLLEKEAQDRSNVFDIPLLAERLIQAHTWIGEQREDMRGLPVGYFGSSTGAAAALVAEVAIGEKVPAVVSRGGRPDLAMEALPKVEAPTLLIIGSLDYEVIELNKRAFEYLRSVKSLELVEGATHLFEEPGTLEKVMVLAADWFTKYFTLGEKALPNVSRSP